MSMTVIEADGAWHVTNGVGRMLARAVLHLCQAWRSITQDKYDKKARELKERQTEIALRIEQHQKGEEYFRMTPLFYLASRTDRTLRAFETEKKEPTFRRRISKSFW